MESSGKFDRSASFLPPYASMYRMHHPHAQQGPGVENSFHPAHWKVVLEILRGQARIRRRPIQTPVFLIGSAADCDLVLGDERFAEVHACILVRDDGVWVRHLGFEPEITVNGTASGRIRLDDGDIIRMGSYEFRISIQWQKGKPSSDSSSIPNKPHQLRIHPSTLDTQVLDQSRRLTQDIRAALRADKTAVCLYLTPDGTLCPSRLAFLSAHWMLSTRQAKGA